MSAGAYEEEIREVREHDWWRSDTEDALVRAFMTCQEHDMHVTIASEIIWGIVQAMRGEYGE